MNAIASKVESAVISVLSTRSDLENIEVIQGKDAVTHAVFPRVVVECGTAISLIPGQAKPLRAKLEVTIQTEAKIDINYESCAGIADNVLSALMPPDGVIEVNATSDGVHLYKMEFNDINEPEAFNDLVESGLKAELYIS